MVVAALLIGLGASCSDGLDDGPGSGPDDEARRALLASFATEVVAPAYTRFVTAARALERASRAHVDGPDETSLEASRAAWRDAMVAWQAAEVFQVGPAAAGDAVGARSLRDDIYSWPIVSPCRVDQVVVEGGLAAKEYFDGKNVNVYGLDALEYLLFHDALSNSCPPQVRINHEGSWSALGDDEVRRRRAAYVVAAASLLAVDAQRLLDAWQGEDGFAAVLSAAGRGGSPTSEQRAQRHSTAEGPPGESRVGVES